MYPIITGKREIVKFTGSKALSHSESIHSAPIKVWLKWLAYNGLPRHCTGDKWATLFVRPERCASVHSSLRMRMCAAWARPGWRWRCLSAHVGQGCGPAHAETKHALDCPHVHKSRCTHSHDGDTPRRTRRDHKRMRTL